MTRLGLKAVRWAREAWPSRMEGDTLVPSSLVLAWLTTLDLPAEIVLTVRRDPLLILPTGEYLPKSLTERHCVEMEH